MFTGGEIVNEFLMSTGYLPGAHSTDCPICEVVLTRCPPWLPYTFEFSEIGIITGFNFRLDKSAWRSGSGDHHKVKELVI
jgi:hypothetical protein